MVTKGIITSIDFNGNTCQVRIPFFETAGNDPITGTAIISNTPGSYNGYKVGDVVLVAFEDGQMNNPVVIGKLYLGAAVEKQDPRGAINVENAITAKSASLPADTILTAKLDPNVPNTNVPFGSLASIANSLNSANRDIGQLDRFANNKFESIADEITEQGEELRSEIEQSAGEITAKVVRKQDGQYRGLSWDLNTESWQINAHDTVSDHPDAEDINIVTIDRSGMSIAGDLKLDGYPSEITVKYKASNDQSTPPDLPNPNTEEDQESNNNEQESNNNEWYNTKQEAEDHAQAGEIYIWEWTHKVVYEYDRTNRKWDTNKDDIIICLVDKAAHEEANNAQEAANNALVVAQGKSTNYYSDTDPRNNGHIIKDGDCWFDTHNYGKLNHIADYANKYIKVRTDSTEHMVKVTAEDIANTSSTIYTLLNNWAPQTVIQVKKVYNTTSDIEIPVADFHPEDYFVKIDSEIIPPTQTSPAKTVLYLYKEDIKEYGRDSIDNEDRFVYLGKEEVDGEILDKWRKQNTIQDIFKDTDYVIYTNNIVAGTIRRPQFTITQEELDTDIKVNIIAYDSPNTNTLRQWVGNPSDQDPPGHWEDIGGELVANKVTANYINALEITAKKIEVKASNNDILFLADGLPGTADTNKVRIAGFEVDHNSISTSGANPGEPNSIMLFSGLNDGETSIGGIEKNNWSILAGDKFGVDYDGNIYASSINFIGGVINVSNETETDGATALFNVNLGDGNEIEPDIRIKGGTSLESKELIAIDHATLNEAIIGKDSAVTFSLKQKEAETINNLIYFKLKNLKAINRPLPVLMTEYDITGTIYATDENGNEVAPDTSNGPITVTAEILFEFKYISFDGIWRKSVGTVSVSGTFDNNSTIDVATTWSWSTLATITKQLTCTLTPASMQTNAVLFTIKDTWIEKSAGLRNRGKSQFVVTVGADRRLAINTDIHIKLIEIEGTKEIHNGTSVTYDVPIDNNDFSDYRNGISGTYHQDDDYISISDDNLMFYTSAPWSGSSISSFAIYHITNYKFEIENSTVSQPVYPQPIITATYDVDNITYTQPIEIGASLLPSVEPDTWWSAHSLGSSDQRWKSIYVDEINGGGAVALKEINYNSGKAIDRSVLIYSGHEVDVSPTDGLAISVDELAIPDGYFKSILNAFANSSGIATPIQVELISDISSKITKVVFYPKETADINYMILVW